MIGGAHRVASVVEASGSRAHRANKPSDDFRYTPVDCDGLVAEDVGDPLDRGAVLHQPCRERVPERVHPMTALLAEAHVRGTGVLDQDLMQMVLVRERADRGGMPQEHLRAIARRPAVADVVDDRPADVLEQRQATPAGRSWPAPPRPGCRASQDQRTGGA